MSCRLLVYNFFLRFYQRFGTTEYKSNNRISVNATMSSAEVVTENSSARLSPIVTHGIESK